MQNKSTSSGCNGPKQGSTCVIWTGQAIPALGIEKGDSITDIVCTIAQQVVNLATPLDLSTITIQCLKDNLNIDEPVERTIANMLQIAYDSSCTLKELIDAINAKLSNSASSLTLNLGCLATFDVYGNPLPYDEQSVLQLLLTTVCGQQTTIATISGTVAAIQVDVNALKAIPQYAEPTLSSCLFTNRKTSDALVITASSLCSYMSNVGQVTDIQSAMAQVPSVFTANYGLLSGWITNPANLAQSYSNAILVISDLYNRIGNIETNCCKVGCDSVVVDFDIKLSDDRTQATLFFATKSNVPAGWTEVNPLGSKLTITDGGGNVYTTYIKVIQQLTNPDGITIDLNSSSIDPSQDYTFGMNVTLTNGTTTCVKCISHTATYKDTCAFCSITVAGSSSGQTVDKVVVIYKATSNGATQYTTIYGGQTQAIPKASLISSVIVYGNATYTSACTLPQPSQTSCWEMSWAFSKSSGNADAVFTDGSFIYLSVLGTQYPINCAVDTNCLNAVFANFYPATVGLINNPVWVYTPSANIQSFKLYFQATSDVAANMEGFIGNPNAANGAGDGFDAGAYFRPIPTDSSNCPQLNTGVGHGAA